MRSIVVWDSTRKPFLHTVGLEPCGWDWEISALRGPTLRVQEKKNVAANTYSSLALYSRNYERFSQISMYPA